MRNRVRRQRLPAELAADVTPKNILMIGPTGVGKTEIARRLARLTGSPFLKVEASKFTEVGYVGRDVESMVRDLTEAAVDMVRREKRAEVRAAAARNAEEQLLDLLLPPRPGAEAGTTGGRTPSGPPARSSATSCAEGTSTTARWRSRWRRRAFPPSRSSPRRASRRWA